MTKFFLAVVVFFFVLVATFLPLFCNKPHRV